MLLAIDAGNTNVVFAVFEGRTLRGSWRMATDARRTSDEYAAWLFQILTLSGFSRADIDAAILGSVVPAASVSLEKMVRGLFRIEPLVVTAALDLGVVSKIRNPAETGVDRLVNAVAARTLYGAPAIVIDIGTATTFDIVDRDGNYAGGVIAPGPHPSLEALHRIAAKLPKIEIVKPARVIGDSTVGAMQSGSFWGYVGLIEGLVARIRQEFGAELPVIGTGGLSNLFKEETPVIGTFDGDLTLKGLQIIHERCAAK